MKRDPSTETICNVGYSRGQTGEQMHSKTGVQRGAAAYVLPLGAVLLNSFAFSMAALPAARGQRGYTTARDTRTLLHEVLLVVHDADVDLGEVADRLVLHLPQLLRDLRDEAYSAVSISVSACPAAQGRRAYGSRATQ